MEDQPHSLNNRSSLVLSFEFSVFVFQFEACATLVWAMGIYCSFTEFFVMTNPHPPVVAVVDPANPNGTAMLAPMNPMSGLAIADGFHMAGTINQADVVAIVRQEAEEKLTEQKSVLDRQLHDLEGKVEGIETILKKIVQQIVSKANLKHARAAARALEQITGIKYEAVATLERRDDEKQVAIVNIQINKPNTSYGNIIEHETAIPYTDVMIEHLRTLKCLRREIGKVQGELMAIKKLFGNLPALERKAHSELVKNTLSQTAAGQALLARLKTLKTPIA